MWTSTNTNEVSNQTEMLSLFDYLGKPAGSELGKRVAEAAVAQKVKIASREVSTTRYTGTILMYPKSFLDWYFGKQVTEQQNEEDSLPF